MIMIVTTTTFTFPSKNFLLVFLYLNLIGKASFIKQVADGCKAKVAIKSSSKALSRSTGSSSRIAMGSVTVHTGLQIYAVAQQAPIVKHILKTIGEKLERFIIRSNPDTYKTREFTRDLNNIIKNTNADEGIESLSKAAINIRLMKNEQTIAPIYSNTKDGVIDAIGNIFETIVKRQKINHILGGIERLDDVTQKIATDILSAVSRLSTIEEKLGAKFFVRPIKKSDGTLVLVP